ncbi:MAG: PEP-CTERM sorting domain-containing protein, partial [Pseudomonadota bacterium]
MLFSRKVVLVLGAAIGLTASPAAAVTSLEFDGVEFPQGAISFADAVVSYDTGLRAPTAPYQGSANALGIPDYVNVNSCPTQEACTFVSLGRGGSIVLQFTDNFLTGS